MHIPIQSFLNHIRFEKRYSPHTSKAYQTDLEGFTQWLQTTYELTDITQITHHHIRSWLAQQKGEGQTAKTLNRKISTLRAFYKYSLQTGVLTTNPMLKVTAPKTEKRLPQFVAEEDMQKLFQNIMFPDDWQGRTDKVLLQLLYSTGMRLSEVIGLHILSFDPGAATLRVLGKGGKERLLPLSAVLVQKLNAYIQERESLPAVSGHLLVTQKGEALRPRAVYDTVKKYLSQVTTISKRSPHVLRHSFATHLTNAGADLNAVKELLGHSSLAATQVYTHNSIDRLKQVHSQAHPKA